MTLDQLAALGEIIASIAVVASLIYVAKQLAQNTDMMRANASEQRVQRNAELSFRVADSQEFADLWRRGGSEFGELGETEQIRLVFFCQTALVHWHSMYRLHVQGLLPNEDWNELIGIIRFVSRRQDVKAAWETVRESYGKPFQEFVDSQLADYTP